ncbi:hypothetical protein O9K63_12250 [Janibacter cremeus]|uniref:hypothetical protein n=1 Tax=Janibacter cremeus TaxID=1285192 RepID=UPI0023F7C5B6|nr:hypothetical protein [Janibacter cremeus]WEV77358.1 hypothetical protein O9K63_12250 [Janibacter cremeus]
MHTLSPTIVKAALAVGGMILVAVIVVLTVLAGKGSAEPELLADSMAGQATRVQVGEGTAVVWVSGSGSADPRPGDGPDPGLCSVTGEGMPSLADPDTTDTTTIGGTTLYPVAQVEDYTAPMKVVCSGGSIDHVYLMR